MAMGKHILLIFVEYCAGAPENPISRSLEQRGLISVFQRFLVRDMEARRPLHMKKFLCRFIDASFDRGENPVCAFGRGILSIGVLHLQPDADST